MLNGSDYFFGWNMYVLTISFCGRNYHGWQFQENAVSVQGVLKNTLSEIFRKECPYPSGCSRTDTGVHALEFIATVPALQNIPAESLKKGLNSLLPDDIRILSVEKKDNFQDGREFVFGKHYRYLICTKPAHSPFSSDLSWHSAYELDIQKMEHALQYFTGTHDFASFMASGSDVKTTVRTIRKTRIFKTDGYIFIDFAGDGFLKHQVRIMSGTLVGVGKGRIEPDSIPSLINAKDRNVVPHTLPGKGLYLYKLFKSTGEMLSYDFPDTFQDMVW